MIQLQQVPTALQVTNLYLYGDLNIPEDKLSEGLIRPPTFVLPDIGLDVNAYMAGPGRFATASMFDVVEQFLNPSLFASSFSLAPGTYDKNQLFSSFGIDAGFVSIQQALYSDGRDDYVERAYIWNSTSFKIADGSQFIVESNGNRYIENFAIVPFSSDSNRENFDFEGQGLSTLANIVLEPKIDPSGIGRQVNIAFSGVIARTTFTYSDYVLASNSMVTANPLLVATLASNLPSFLEELFDSGSTKFLDPAGRFILYGTDTSETLAKDSVDRALMDSTLSNAIDTKGIAFVAGKGNDTIEGTTRNDVLYGGTGNDTYQFTGLWGKDLIADTDRSGSIQIDGQTIGQAKGAGQLNTWVAELGAGSGVFVGMTVYDDARSSTGKRLVIVKGGDTSNSITIDHFDLTAAQSTAGFLGIKLDPARQIVVKEAAGGVNTWSDARFEAGSLAGQSSDVIEGGAKSFTVYLNQAAKAGETLTLSLGAVGGQFQAIITPAGGGTPTTVAAQGAVITLAAGQTQVSFALLQQGAVSADASGQLSVSYAPAQGSAVASNAWGVNLKDAGNAGQTQRGDQRPEQLDGAGNYFWASTSWAADGTLNGGVAAANFSDVLRGGAGNDTLSGLGGNDALDGGAGNDTLDGGEGDDLIGGGAGSDTIRGGAGNDYINTSATLNVAQRLRASDSWSAPGGQAVLTQGARWGVYLDTLADGDAVTIWSGSNSPSGTDADVVDAGDGDDWVIAGGGSDQVDGGNGDDQLDGMGGGDVLRGGAGKDTINGDGIAKPGYMNSLDGAQHGSDFIDGGAGDDNLRGAGGDDVIVGGADNDHLYGDDSGQQSDAKTLGAAFHGRDVLEGGAGDDYLEGGGRDDRLYGGEGNDNLWGDTDGANVDTVAANAIYWGNDFLDGGAGDDQLTGGGKNDSLFGGAGDDAMWGDQQGTELAGEYHGEDLMYGEAGNDYMEGGGGADTLYGGSGNDSMHGDDQANLLGAEFQGDDYLDGGEGDDDLSGGGGDDVLVGGVGNDTLLGGLGDDLLLGGEGNDFLDGGEGADVMIGGAGDDTYVVNDEGDVVIDNDPPPGSGSGTPSTDQVQTRVSYVLGSTIENLTLTGTADINGTGNAQRNLMWGNSGANALSGGAGNDQLDGGGGADVLMGGTGDDTYIIDDAAVSVVEAAGEGDDIVLTTVSHTLADNVERIQAQGSGSVNLGGNALNNGLFGNSGNNSLTGGQGNDYLEGKGGNDVYVFNRGDGQDTINNTDFLRDTADATKVQAVDTLQFGAGVAESDVTAQRVGNSLVLRIRGTSDSVFVNNHFAAEQTSGTVVTDQRLDRVQFASGAVWNQARIQTAVDAAASNRAPVYSGTLTSLTTSAALPFSFTLAPTTFTDPDAGDVLVLSVALANGAALPDWLVFDSATRTLSGTPTAAQVGALSIAFKATDSYGASTTVPVAFTVQPNRAPVVSVPLSDQRVEHNASFSLLLEPGAFTDPDAGENLQFSATLANGSPLPSWVSFNPALRSFNGVAPASGTVSIKVTAVDAVGSSVSDVFDLIAAQLTVGTAGADSLVGTAGDDTLQGLAGNDTLNGGAGNDTLDGGSGTDILIGAQGDDLLIDGETMQGGPGNDTYQLTTWPTGYVYIDEDTTGGFDRLKLPVASTEVQVARLLFNSATSWAQPEDLVLTRGGNANHAVIVRRHFLFGDQRYRIEEVEFSDGVVWGHEVLYEKSLTASAYDFLGQAFAEVINMDGVRKGAYGYGGDDVITGTGLSETISGGTGNDLLNGGGGADEIWGDEGNDILVGGRGNDRLLGGSGNDIYRVARGDGSDQIAVAGDGADILELTGGILQANVQLFRDGNDMVVSIDQGQTQVRVVSHFSFPSYKLATIRFSDGAIWNATQIATQIAPTSSNAMVGSIGNDQFLVDHINDTVTELPDQGIDSVLSSITYTLGANVENLTLTGVIDLNGTGNDLNNRIIGNSGANRLDGAGGSDTLEGGAGDDFYVVSGSDDIVIERADEGVDEVFTQDSFSLPEHVENLSTSTAQLGYNRQGSFIGNALNNTIRLGALYKNSVVDGGAGADIMITEGDNTTFYVDNVNDQVVASGGYGHVVISSVNWSLQGNRTTTLKLVGQGLIGEGTSGNDILEAVGLNNTLAGLGGDDRYKVQWSAAQQKYSAQIIEIGDGGSADVVTVSGDVREHRLSDFAFIEELRLDWDAGAANILGDDRSNRIVGNSRSNILDGGAGDDYIVSGGGGDQLLGGSGRDTLVGTTLDVFNGGAGDDQLIVSRDALFSAGIIFGFGSGQDRLTRNSDYWGQAASVTVLFSEAVDAANLNVIRNGRDLILEISASDRLVIIDYFNNDTDMPSNGGSLWVQFSSGLILNPSHLIQRMLGGNPVNGSAGADILLGSSTGDQLFGLGGNDMIWGEAGADQLLGGDGDDSLNGGAGNDLLSGGAGDDFLEGGADDDTLLGGDGADTLSGGDGADVLEGGAGDDTIHYQNGADTFRFSRGDGRDTVVSYGSWYQSEQLKTIEFGSGILASDVSMSSVSGSLTLSLSGGNDSITLSNMLGAGMKVQARFSDGLVWTADDLRDAARTIVGDEAANALVADYWNASKLLGLGGNDTLTGGYGDDELDGGTGADVMAGGYGDDTYWVDNASDLVNESIDQGQDRVISAISYTLRANVEALELTGSSNLNGTGNSLANRLVGNSGNNNLNGGGGADTMEGGAGNDIYVVDNINDLVVEASGEGMDLVQSSVSYSLSENVENLTLTGAGSINATGNALDNVLTGNSGVNVLTGGAGNDLYVVGAGDSTIEALGAGIDTVQSAVSWTLANNLENLILTGAGAINGTGNALDNVLTGNSGANILTGGAGNDIYIVGVGDTTIEASGGGIDAVQSGVTWTLASNLENLSLTGTSNINASGNELANTLTGNSGNNVLNGGLGADTMAGGAGNDTYVVDNTGDVITEAASAGTDLVQSSISYTLGTNLENLTLTGAANINGTGNSVANVLTGNGGHNTLNGGAGGDTMIGGAGNDTYIVDDSGDVVTEAASAGTDLVQSSVSFTLGNNVENLTLTGTAAINGTGNSAANVLTGNSGNNTLNGAGGADTMIGGAGNDTYVVDNTGDVVTELSNQGVDLVQSSVSHTLSANVENLTLTGTGNTTATGNELVNSLTGNSGNNTLTGGAGNDTLNGGAGADSLVGGSGNDTYWLGRGFGIDTITENDATAGNTDVARFEAGIATDQLWFAKSGNHLNVSIIGTSDRFTLNNWYLGDQYRVEQFKTSDGKTLLDSQVQNLVSAMAGFSPPAAGQTTLSASQATALAPVISANWQ
jgi:Ca2+-binding RTX toxin-like protein